MWAIIRRTLGIERRLFLVYYPEINGAKKRVNQVIQSYLHIYTTFSQNNWEDLLSIA